MAEQTATQGIMSKVQNIIETKIVPPLNKITANFWFSLAADAILYIVPFSMVSAIPNLWNFIRNFFPALPDLSPITTLEIMS